MIGHFLVVGNPLSGELIAIGLTFGSDGQDRLQWTVGVTIAGANGGIGGVDAGGLTYIDPNIDRTWSYTWNPTGGVNGGGLLTGTLSGPGGGTKTVDLTPTQRATLALASVNAFGISVGSPSQSNSSEFANIFIDDVSYSIANSTFLLGDFNRDAHVNSADIPVMLNVLSDLNPYKNILQYTASQLLSIEDINGDGKFTNADVQALLNYLKAGGGSVTAVPEPTNFFGASLGLLTLVGLRIRRPQ